MKEAKKILREHFTWKGEVDIDHIDEPDIDRILSAMDEYANLYAMRYAKQFKDLVHKQSLAIGLVLKHFPKDIMSDQMGEDHDTFLEAIK